MYWGLEHDPMKILCEFEKIHWKLKGEKYTEENEVGPLVTKKKRSWPASCHNCNQLVAK